MSWDFVNLKPHPHRTDSGEAYVFINKTLKRSNKPKVNALHFSVLLRPLPVRNSLHQGPALISHEDAVFSAIADLDESIIIFDIAGAASVIPSTLRGGGLGGLALSELVIWLRKNYSHFNISPINISQNITNYPNGALICRDFLEKFGFNVQRNQQGGLTAQANNVAALNVSVNKNKLVMENPASHCDQLIQSHHEMDRQLSDALQETVLAKEQLHQLTEAKHSTLPFYGGILLGLVAGSALSILIIKL